MNKQTLLQLWDHLRQSNGIAMRVIASLPADKLDSHPIPNMRTPKELVVHLYDVVLKAMAEGVVKGEITADEGAEKRIAAGIKSRDELLKFARDNWNAADKAVASITDHLQKYWDPRMRRTIIAEYDSVKGRLDPLVQEAVEKLPR